MKPGEEILIEMLKHYGLKEIAGEKDNPVIVEMFKEIGFEWVKDDETSWCSAVLNYFCKKLSCERSGKLDARSWLKTGIEITDPEPGDIVVFWRNKPESWEGHVGLYINSDDQNIFVLGGNQGDMLNISAYPKTRLLGYRRLSKLK